VTTQLLTEALRRLRAVGARSSSANQRLDLWRGVRHTLVPHDFMECGGTELAPMSTTAKLDVALDYLGDARNGSVGQGVLFKMHTASSLERGADIAFLSAFPEEEECLFPPLTFLRVTGSMEVSVGDALVSVIEVVPVLGS
jgi:hypothetical protein